MVISLEERSRINTANARKGGPRSAEGKRRSSMNALKHGLRADTLVLPDEDPAAVQSRIDEWHDFYRPRSPAERALIDKAVLSLHQSDRLRRYETAALSEKVRLAEEVWDADREDEVARLVETFQDNPAAAVRGLKRTGAGCRWLLDQWGGLQAALETDGWWSAPSHLHLATRLLGMRPEMSREDDVYWLRLINLAVDEEGNAKAIAWLMHPQQMPDSLRGVLADGYPSPEHSRQELADVVAREVADLSSLEELIRTRLDEPSQAQAADRALILDDDAGRLWHRYSVSANNAFHRAHRDFLKTRTAEAEIVAAEPLADEPNLDREADLFPGNRTVEAEIVVAEPLPGEPNLDREAVEFPVNRAASEAPPAPSPSPRAEPIVVARREVSAPDRIETRPVVAPLPNEPNLDPVWGEEDDEIELLDAA